MSKILVLLGGNSPERDVSLRSADAVVKALRQNGHIVTTFDTKDDLEVNSSILHDIDVVFSVLHGINGEDGVMQKILESHGCTFVGTNSTSSALCFNKSVYKQLMQKNNVPTPKGDLVDKESFWHNPLLKNSFVLKPFDGGSSIDTLIVRNPDDLNRADIASVFERHKLMLLEQLISGTEVTVGILKNMPLPIIEIIPPTSGEFDYVNKYNGATQELCPPKHVNQETQLRAQKLALKIHLLTGCKDMSRTDFMINEQGDLFVLETNTIPGLTAQSLYPKMARTAGYDMASLVQILIGEKEV